MRCIFRGHVVGLLVFSDWPTSVIAKHNGVNFACNCTAIGNVASYGKEVNCNHNNAAGSIRSSNIIKKISYKL